MSVQPFSFSSVVIPHPLQLGYGDVIVIAARHRRKADSRAAVPRRCAALPIAMAGG
ncbi:hypothetical protein R3Q06_34575 [Rhodococcus erythropolis]|uniref:hypothetical protein n=1 Tax=Rhodococcus erythropolis TaxID=1833 RepID=UPI00294A9346|nr:hypothetical protein [Rhodococcus erythropolis]MDV6278527.1 hypothetical protein [Rhodococcus erythropolis]